MKKELADLWKDKTRLAVLQLELEGLQTSIPSAWQVGDRNTPSDKDKQYMESLERKDDIEQEIAMIKLKLTIYEHAISNLNLDIRNVIEKYVRYRGMMNKVLDDIVDYDPSRVYWRLRIGCRQLNYIIHGHHQNSTK